MTNQNWKPRFTRRNISVYFYIVKTEKAFLYRTSNLETEKCMMGLQFIKHLKPHIEKRNLGLH